MPRPTPFPFLAALLNRYLTVFLVALKGLRFARHPESTLLAFLVAGSVILGMPLGLGAQTASGTGGGKTLTVAVSILPLEYFVKRVGGARVSTVVLVGPGQSPHSYEPTPRQMAQLGQASAWFTTDIEFEHALVPKVQSLYPKLLIVDTADGVPTRGLEAHGHDIDEHEAPVSSKTKSPDVAKPEKPGASGSSGTGGSTGSIGSGTADGHGHEDDHDEEGGRDPHIWLGKTGALAQAAKIRDTLASLDPPNASTYKKNYDAFADEVQKVFADLARQLAPMKGKAVFVYHPAFGYFLDEFGIEQVAVETGGKEPTQKSLAALIAEARLRKAATIFVQPQFSRTAASSVAKAIGGVVVEIDDLAGDWLGNIRKMGAAIGAATGSSGR